MATSLSSITDLGNYSLNGKSLSGIIDGNDIKIEISLGSSKNDNSESYASYKLDLNYLLTIISTYISKNNINEAIPAVKLVPFVTNV